MSDDQAERRTVPTMAVLEWRVTQLETGLKELATQMGDTRRDILHELDKHAHKMDERLDSMEKRPGTVTDRAILALAALGSLGAFIATLVHR